jgi:uncharacterized protein (DUF2236 family)
MPINTQPPESHGHFGPDSATWHIYRESVFLLGGVRALLLQVAHPAIADGVARFSNFEKDAFGRAIRTFLAMGTLYFGNKTQANAVGDRLFRIHSGITGSYLTREGDQNSSRNYTANDPDLLLWVHATLVDTSIRVYEATMGKMPPELAEQFYTESRLAAQIMHVPEAAIPKSLAEFQSYFEQVLQSGDLYLSKYGEATGLAVLDHKIAPSRAARWLAAGMLPDYLCPKWHIQKKAKSEQSVTRFLSRFGFMYRLLPIALRAAPAYHQARYRVAVSEGKRPPVLGRFWWSVASRWKRFPLTIPTV